MSDEIQLDSTSFNKNYQGLEGDRRLALNPEGARHRPTRPEGREGDAGLPDLQGPADEGPGDAGAVLREGRSYGAGAV